ncbi:MAG: NUDIX hydrolase [Neorhizobium sp.]|nr:NUDIX hydrolase [Neorhizobium sp.]
MADGTHLSRPIDPIIDNLADWPAEKTIFPLKTVQIRVLSGIHPVVTGHGDEIAQNWAGEIAANPALWDGQMLFEDRISITGDGLFAEAYVAPFSSFLWWRRHSSRQQGRHIFAYPVLESSDGALVAIRMGQHTANAGQVYFASGSFEPMDLVDGVCDVEANMRREVREETGLDLADAEARGGFHASHFRAVVSLVKLYRFALTADEMVAAIEKNMPVAEDKEIAGAVAIRSADPEAQRYNISMLPVLDWYFSGGSATFR